MTREELEVKTNKELIEIIENAGLEIVAKNPSKPTKAELLAVLIDEDNVDDRPVKTEVVKENKTKKQSAEQLKKERRRYYRSRVRVIVRDLDDSATKVDSIFVTWGNDEIGIQPPEPIFFDRPTHVTVGALAKLEEQTYTKFEQEPGSNTVNTITAKRYAIERLDPLTEEELKRLKESQLMRKGRADLLANK